MRYLLVWLLSLSSTLTITHLAQADTCDHEVFLKKVCISSQPQALSGTEMKSLVCEDPAQFPVITKQLDAAFAMAPAWLQQRLCGLSGFGVYPTLPGQTTYSWSYFDANYMGLSKNYLDQVYSFDQHQQVMLRQALKQKNFAPGQVLPADFGFQYSAASPNAAGLGVLYLMTHETGHLIYHEEDKLRSFGRCLIFISRVCPQFPAYQWGSQSWIDAAGDGPLIFGTPLAENAALVGFVRPENKSTLSVDEADNFFKSLWSSNFATAFALYSPEEDFCETLAAKVVATNLDSWIFRFSDGSALDLRARLVNPQSPGLLNKIQFVRTNVIPEL